MGLKCVTWKKHNFTKEVYVAKVKNQGVRKINDFWLMEVCPLLFTSMEPPSYTPDFDATLIWHWFYVDDNLNTENVHMAQLLTLAFQGLATDSITDICRFKIDLMLQSGQAI